MVLKLQSLTPFSAHSALCLWFKISFMLLKLCLCPTVSYSHTLESLAQTNNASLLLAAMVAVIYCRNRKVTNTTGLENEQKTAKAYSLRCPILVACPEAKAPWQPKGPHL